ncbi:hypothetical protein SASPL_107748 [Salvia splendens]|uniref:Uncharacterized protein n=1 Tax=Salvia splendens TaxID=180675 RepID=A0A8X8YBR4_SALSN|nr:uncharacterized protein LOC121794819 [Salvia splendens]KAG6429696.1 hypothetical protein SASPL_107748 [Salvia splendens]
MAENSPKRQRDDSIGSDLDDSCSIMKRQKPYNNILNLLDEDEPEPSHQLSQDLSAMFTTLEQELSSSGSGSGSGSDTFDFEPLQEASEHSQPLGSTGDEDESVKSVMRHLLEASDDELGIPNTTDENGVENFNGAEDLPFAFTDHELWEFEDVAANYYTVLQSELFM